MATDSRVDSFDLSRDARSVSRARRIVSDTLTAKEPSAVVDTALLLVSELVGNAVRYGAEPIVLDLRRADDGVTIGVSDSAPEMPKMPPPGPAALADSLQSDELEEREQDGGRGLRLIETLADRWGVERRHKDKRVWFALCR